MKKVTCITINTDASFHPKHKVGGYAFTIVCDVFRIKISGIFKKEPRNITEAETMCIGNAIHTLLSQPSMPKCNVLVINTDCLPAIANIKKGKTTAGQTVGELYKKAVTDTDAKKHEFRHVKAHSGVNDCRSYTNAWCDTEAKKQMKKSLKKKLRLHGN